MYQKSLKGWLKHIDFIILELIAFQLAFCLSYCMRHGLGNPYRSLMYRNTAIVAVMIQIFVIIGFNIFRDVMHRGYYREFTSSIKTALLVMLMMVFYLFSIQKGSEYSRVALLTNGIYYWAFAYLFRITYRNFIKAPWGETAGDRSLIIIATKENVSKIIEDIRENASRQYQLTGLILVDEEQTGGKIDGVPIVANREGAAEYICRDWVDEVYLDVPESDEIRDKILHILMEMGIVVHVPFRLTGVTKGMHKVVDQIGNQGVITVSANVLEYRDAFIKRAMDIVGGLAGCLLTGILFLFLAPAIFIKSPGPIFFSQMRVGKNGRMFRMYKFRSMYMDAEERKQELMDQNEMSDGMMFKMENDPRIIGSEKGPGKGIGNFIRKTSLDEFPQFLNVLKGDMSLVGTRPPTVDEWEQYNFHHRGRMSVKPGLTGLWQVSGRSEITDFDEVVALDQEYIENWSLGTDIKILLKTVMVVVTGAGAK